MKLIYISLLLLIATPSFAYQETKTVSANQPGLECTAYLHRPEGVDTPLPLVFWQAGSGIYSVAEVAQASSHVEYLFNQKKIALLTMDKPGISFDANDPDNPKVDHSIYNKHTAKDLVECAKNSLAWAETHTSLVKKFVILSGHSEGSVILVRMYKDLLSTHSDLTPYIDSLVLSGTPLLDFKEIINSQLSTEEDKSRFWNAFAQKDDKTLKEYGSLAYAYWEDILQTEPLKKTMRDLVSLKPAASFNFFHGLFDKNTSVESLLELETWNREQAKADTPFLKLSARYYNANHYLNLAAMNDMVFMILANLE